MESHFARWPGTDSHPLGLGRALVDFQDWEISSGRLSDDGGSPWWSAVNGRLISDLEDAAAGARGPWADYMSCDGSDPEAAQAALWHAHQHSINAGALAAAGLLESEPDVEREFAGIALAVVDMAAGLGHRTSSGALGRQTRGLYPRAYPSTEADLARIRAVLAEPDGPGSP
jgi:hypothetical protein